MRNRYSIDQVASMIATFHTLSWYGCASLVAKATVSYWVSGDYGPPPHLLLY